MSSNESFTTKDYVVSNRHKNSVPAMIEVPGHILLYWDQETQQSNPFKRGMGSVFMLLDLDLTASFSFSSSGNLGRFSDTSSGLNTTYLWDFGDGGTSTSQNPSHTYSSYGTFDVTLTVTDEYGATNSTTQTITILSPAEQATESINALIPVVIAATSLIVVVSVLSNGLIRPLSNLFRRTR
jgi:PKD repeat protein